MAPAMGSASDNYHLRCPKCGSNLDQVEMMDIPIEKCPECHGIWLDSGELDLIVEREKAQNREGWLVKIFKKTPKS